MDGVASPADQQTLVSSFLEIAVGQSADTARQFLQATSWKLEEAIQLFYIGNEGGSNAAYEPFAPIESEVPPAGSSLSTSRGVGGDNIGQEHEEDVRAPLPVIRDVLYDNAISYSASRIGGGPHETRSVVPFRNFEEERKRSGVWELENGSASTVDDSRDNLASLYRPPFTLMYHGTFKNAKDAASVQNKWLLVNLQSTREFSSHMLNRDTWADEAVAQTIKTNFIFWQVYDDTEEGSKVCTYYKLDSIPVVLVIDPVTGQKMRSWRGMIQPQNLLEDLLPFMDGSPTDHHISLSNKRPRESHRAPTERVPDEGEDEEMARALAASMEGVKDVGGSYRNENDDESSLKDPPGPGVSSSPIITKPPPTYPLLPEEPKGGDRNLLCRVGMRLPDGRRLQRNFLRADPIQLLWSFCWSELEGQDKTRPFRLSQAIPGSAKSLDFDTSVTFEESGLANSMISVTWE